MKCATLPEERGTEPTGPEMVRLMDRLSPAEIAMLLRQDPDWTFPAGATDGRRRLAEGIAILVREQGELVRENARGEVREEWCTTACAASKTQP